MLRGADSSGASTLDNKTEENSPRGVKRTQTDRESGGVSPERKKKIHDVENATGNDIR